VQAVLPARSTTQREPSGSAITLRGVVKRFGQLTAIDGLDLDVRSGACVGLLGPNGAGKSTTMKALTAQVIPDSGEIEVLGYRVPDDSKQARAEMGVVPQLDNLDVSLTVDQNLLVFAHLYRVPAAERKAAIDRALDLANLRPRRDAKVDQLSGGMRRRLLIARGLLHRPRLLLLDEPTIGLDPQVRQELWALIDKLRSDGVSILMSTHYIEEAERLCDEVTIMSHGVAVAVGAPRDLIAEYAGPEAVEVYGSPARLQEVEEIARGRGWRTRRTGTSVAILDAAQASGGHNGLGEAGLDGERRVTNLEDVFVLLTGEEIA
jgi:lipooligosaccharide transport system ATP-binding protein